MVYTLDERILFLMLPLFNSLGIPQEVIALAYQTMHGMEKHRDAHSRQHA
jgi:hypothetical protein